MFQMVAEGGGPEVGAVRRADRICQELHHLRVV